jgi:hypothetical protein
MNMLSNSLEGLAYQLHIDRQFLDGAEAEARGYSDRALRAYAEICLTRRRLHELVADAGTRSGRSSRW